MIWTPNPQLDLKKRPSIESNYHSDPIKFSASMSWICDIEICSQYTRQFKRNRENCLPLWFFKIIKTK